jgi:hypothetical protein
MDTEIIASIRAELMLLIAKYGGSTTGAEILSGFLSHLNTIQEDLEK